MNLLVGFAPNHPTSTNKHESTNTKNNRCGHKGSISDLLIEKCHIILCDMCLLIVWVVDEHE